MLAKEHNPLLAREGGGPSGMTAPPACMWMQERRESVLVSAHTSAGKTVVAEWVCTLH